MKSIGYVGSVSSSPYVSVYRADLTATGHNDPGPGKFRYNAEDQLSATSLYFDWITVDDFDSHVLYKLMERPSQVMVQDSDFAINHQIWNVAGVIEYPDWFEVTVTLAMTGGSGLMQNNKQCAVIVMVGLPR